MKHIIPFWIACATVASASVEDDAARAAISFLEKARSGEIDLTVGKDTAISIDTGSEKKEEIARRIKSLRAELPGDPFTAGPALADGEYAAVIVRQAYGYDPSRYRTHAIGVVHKDHQWLAAPVPGSFENTDTGYDAALRAREQKLESWMLKTRALDLLSLQDGAAAALRDEIGKHINLEATRKLDAAGFIQLLLAACAKADTVTLLACLGGADTTLPDNWPERVRAATNAYTPGQTPSATWRILGASGAIRCQTIQEAGPNKATVLLYCLDPSPHPADQGEIDPNPPHFESLRMNISRGSSGLWRYDPPEDSLVHPEQDDNDSASHHSVTNSQGFEILRDLRRQIPATPMPGAREAADAWLAGLRGPSFPDTFRMLSLEGNPGAPLTGCSIMAYLWQRVHDPRRPRIPLLLDFHENGSSAVCIIQLFSAANPSDTDLQQVFFHKYPQGWLLHPAILPPQPSNTPEITSLYHWAEQLAATRPTDWPARLTADLPHIRDLSSARTPGTDEVRRLIDTWLNSLRQGDLSAALATSSQFADERGADKLLRSLGSLLALLRTPAVKASVLAIQTNGHWAGVSLRVDDPHDPDSPSYPFFAVVITPQGARVLPEINLSYATTRTREYLNTTTWSRLATLLPKDQVDELHNLFGGHIKAAAADRPPQPEKPQQPAKPLTIPTDIFPGFSFPLFQP